MSDPEKTFSLEGEVEIYFEDVEIYNALVRSEAEQQEFINDCVEEWKESMKQIIVMRAELNMSRGKEIAQGAHASMKAVVENIDDARVRYWLDGRFTKVVLAVDTEQELLDLYEQAKAKNLICALIMDEGLTEFNGVHTNTCISIGPDEREKIDEVTGHLNLR